MCPAPSPLCTLTTSSSLVSPVPPPFAIFAGQIKTGVAAVAIGGEGNRGSEILEEAAVRVFFSSERRGGAGLL